MICTMFVWQVQRLGIANPFYKFCVVKSMDTTTVTDFLEFDWDYGTDLTVT